MFATPKFSKPAPSPPAALASESTRLLFDIVLSVKVMVPWLKTPAPKHGVMLSEMVQRRMVTTPVPLAISRPPPPRPLVLVSLLVIVQSVTRSAPAPLWQIPPPAMKERLSMKVHAETLTSLLLSLRRPPPPGELKSLSRPFAMVSPPKSTAKLPALM